ncbi:MAG: hypothetical protein MJY80_06835 [Bacteroidales bacterium]|nr:hypothetical protein [Bacteroidales bacterium]
MKNIYKIFRTLLAVAILTAVSACNTKDIDEPGTVELDIKVFFPTKVVAGQPMTINGSGFLEATEIVFPNGVSVTDFEIVSGEMIRVTAPSGISAEGGKLIIRTAKEEVESRLPLTLGHTVVTGYSKQEGEEIEGGEQLTIFGEDLEFINGVEFLDVDGNPMIVPEEDFYRKGTSTVIVTIPRTNIFTGSFAGKVLTYDGKEFTMPELSYKPASGGGHWEVKKHFLWENDGTPVPAWGGTFRFGLVGRDGNNECIATFDQESWDIIKNGTFYFLYDGNDGSNVRITTGWWSAAYGGPEHNCIDFATDDEETGKKTIEINIKEDGNIYDLIDDQHLLFTGDAYTPIGIYVLEEVWVGDGHMEIQKNSFWKNGTGEAIPAWGGTFRFGMDGKDGNNECIATFNEETWNIIKSEPFRVAIEKTVDYPNIRITTGWWSTDYMGKEHNCFEEIQEDEDGVLFLEIDLTKDEALLAAIDDQHLLFTGDGYKLLEIYQQEEVWVEDGGGDEPKKEIILWEGEAIADDWGNQPNLLSDAGIELQEAGATAGQEVRFYITPTDSPWFLEIVEGHWGGTYASFCSPGANDGSRIEWDLDANGGYIPLTLTQEMLDVAYVQQWWGGTFIGNGDNVKITKITLF